MQKAKTSKHLCESSVRIDYAILFMTSYSAWSCTLKSQVHGDRFPLELISSHFEGVGDAQKTINMTRNTPNTDT